MFNLHSSGLFGFAVALVTVPGQAAIIYVDDSATGANNGTSWNDAYTNLQSALGAAQSGDEIRVGQGVYRPGPANAPRTSTFSLVNGTILQGGYAGVNAADPDALDSTKFETILNGDLNSDDVFTNPSTFDDNAYHVLTADGVNSSTRLAGFTIQSGRADLLDTCGSIGTHDRGGGFFGVNGAANLIEDCVFVLNAAVCFGGGAFLGHESPTPTVRRCRFEANYTTAPSGGIGSGAGLASFADCVIEDSVFIDNDQTVHGGGAHVDAGIVRRCAFIDNHAQEAGGGLAGEADVVQCLFMGNSGSLGAALNVGDSDVINCRFLGNQGNCGAPTGASAVNSGGAARVINCLFSGNEGGLGAVHFSGTASTRHVINSTFIANVGACFPSAAGGLNASSTHVRNCIFWDNAGNQTVGQSSQIRLTSGSIHKSIVQDWDGSLGGFGNSGVDPELVDPNGPDNLYGTEDDNPRLSAESPCRDEGNNAFLPPDEFDLDGDGDTAERTPLDLDDLPRMVNGIVDIGAFEFQGPACVADITPASGDGTVDVNDLLTVVGQWGPCPSDCSGDIDNNGVVDVNDLLAVIGAWGDCP